MNDEQARWLDRRITERQTLGNEISQVVARALSSGKRFRVRIEYLEPNEHWTLQQEGDRIITVPSGPPEERR